MSTSKAQLRLEQQAIADQLRAISDEFTKASNELEVFRQFASQDL